MRRPICSVCVIFVFVGFWLPLMAGIYEDGMQLASQNQYKEASLKLKEFIDKSSNDKRVMDARFTLAEMFLASGSILEAATVYESVLTNNPTEAQDMKARVKAAKCLEARGEFDRAISKYKEFIRKYRDKKDIHATWLYIAKVYRRTLGKHKDAERELLMLLARYPKHANNAEALWELAETYRTNLSDIRRAQKIYTKLITQFPKDQRTGKALLKSAYLLEDGGIRDWAKSVMEYRKYVEAFPKAEDLAQRYFRIAYLYRDRLNQYQNAIDYYDKAFAVNPSVKTLRERATAVQRSGKPEATLAAFKLILSKYPDSSQAHSAWRGLASALWDMGKKDDYVKTTEEMLKKFANDVNDWWSYGHKLREMKRWVRALEVYDHITKNWSTWDVGDVYVHKSWVFCNHFDDAMARSAAAEKEKRSDVAAKAKAEAQQAIQEATAPLQPIFTKWKGHIDPNVKALWHLGYEVHFLRSKNYDEAIKNFQRLISNYQNQQRANKDHSIRWLVESHLAKSKSLDGAAQFVSRVLKKDPYSENMRQGIAYLMSRYNQMNEYQKVIALARSVLDFRQSGYGEAWTLLYLGDAYGGAAAQEGAKNVASLHQKQLEVFARLDTYRRNGSYSSIHSTIDSRRNSVIKPLLRAQSYEIESPKEMRLKIDKEGESDETWATGVLDDTWKPTPIGKDWGDYDGIGWYSLEINATGAHGDYRISFANVDDEMWLYVDGKLKGNHAGRGNAFNLTFDPEKTEGKIRLAIKVKDNGSTGGIVGAVTIEKPKLIGREESLNIALARHALGQQADALRDYQDWLKELKTDDKTRDRVVPYQNWIYAQQKNLERLTANPPMTPSVDYQFLLGSVNESRSKPTQAEVAYKKAVEIDPKNRNAHLSLARFYERRSNWKGAHDTYIDLIAVMKGQPDEIRFKGHLVSIVNDKWRNHGRAREIIRQFAAEHPDSSYWMRRYADHLNDYNLGDKEKNQKALSSYQKWFMKKDGLDPWHAGQRLWDCIIRTGNFNAAKVFCTMWLRQFPDNPSRSEMQYRFAETIWQMGKDNEAAKEQALMEFQKVQKNQPHGSGTINAIYRVIDNYPTDVSLAMINQWEKDNKRNVYTPIFLWKLGSEKIERQKDGFPKALELYRRIWKDYRWRWAENLYAYDRIANHHWSQKKFDEAYAIYQEAMTHFGNNRDGRILNGWWRYANKFGKQARFTTEVDSTYEKFDQARLADGTTDGRGGHPNYSWASVDSQGEHWIDCVTATPEEIRRIDIWWGNAGDLPKQIKLQYFAGGKYVDIPEFSKFQAPDRVNVSLKFKAVKTNKIRILQAAKGGPTARAGLMQVAEIRLYREIKGQLWADLEAHYRRMMSVYRHSYEQWSAGRSLCLSLGWRREFLKADIELQKLLYAIPVNHSWFFDEAVKEAKRLMDAERYGEAAAIYRTLLNRNRQVDAKRKKDVERQMGIALSKSGEDYAAIDPNLPEAGLLWGSVFARTGEEDLAWERFEGNRELFNDHQHKLSFDYITLIVSRLLNDKEQIRNAIHIGRQFLIKRKDDRHVTNSERAHIQLLIGDAYFRQERFDIARDEYNTVLTLPEYKNLPEALEGRFKIGATLVAQKIYSKAQEIFEDLTKSPDENIIGRAHMMLGILFHAKGDRKAAEEKFKEVLALAPKNETADEIIYRLGTVYQERKKYKEALDALRLIGAWSGESKRVVEPGRALRIRLSDRDLTVARGSTEVPVIVTTSSGDTERILLEKSEVGKGLFVAEIDTILGSAESFDRKLQVMGNDTITYKYDPKWAADFKILDQDAPPPVITVAADSVLKASATEIKDEEELEIDPDLFNQDEQKRTGYRLFRDEEQLKPGNNVYVQVDDADRDISNGADKIVCQVDATSGDTVAMTLEETEPHSGRFRGALLTGLRPADILASDFSEGREPRYAIDGKNEANSSWMGAFDARAPKWIRVDLKEVYSVSKFVWSRGKGFDEKEDQAPIRYLIESSKDRKTWFPVAFEPANQSPIVRNAIGIWNPDGSLHYLARPSSMLEGNGNVSKRWMGKDQQSEWVVDIDFGKSIEIHKTILKNHDSNNEVKRYAIYTETHLGKYPGRTKDNSRWTIAYQSNSLGTPKHDTASFAVPEKPKEGERSQPLVARYIRLVVTECFGAHPEIGEFEVYPRIEFKTEKPEKGIGASFTFPPVDGRFFRMTINEFHNDAPAIAHIAIFDKEGKKLVPTGQNLHELATNNLLELSPGDEVTVTYLDERNIHPGEPKAYRESLSATFFNGFIQAIIHDFYEDESGNRHKQQHVVRRIRPGDRFIVRIVDYDEDNTDGIDKIPFIVTTNIGKKIELEALETEPYSGVFTKEVDTSPDERPGYLMIEEGNTLTISFVDRENTDPGHKSPRMAQIDVAVPTPGRVRVIPNVKLDYRLPVKFVALEKDMVVEVEDPDAALNSGDTVKVKLNTTNGAEIEVECKIVGGRTDFTSYGTYRSAVQSALDIGLFRGEIRVALGDKSSPTQRVLVTGFGDSEFSSTRSKKTKRRKARKEGPMMDILNVMGGDIITVRYIDETTPDNPLPTERFDSAKIISDAEFGVFDDEYEDEVEYLHVGEKIYIQVIDADMDITEDRDSVKILLQSTFDDGQGDELEVSLVETLSHSGIFAGAIPIAHSASAVPGNNAFECNFGSKVSVSYLDKYNTTSPNDPVKLSSEVEVVTGTDGEMIAFSRAFPDSGMAVEAQFRVGECYYYLGKNHVLLKQSEMGLKELNEGQEILTELLVHFPEAELVDQIGYLLGNIAQEQNKWDDAVLTYRRITRDYPESIIAADSQYKIAMCYEKKGEFDIACEEYVRLAYKFPQSDLVSDSMIRIGLYYFNKKKYEIALLVFQRFTEKFEEHSSVEKVAFKMGLCYILSEQFIDGGDHFKGFVDKYAESELRPAALYWAGDSYLKGGNALFSYQMFKRGIWDYPESKWAKYARGRLTAPVFDRIAEQE